MPVSKAQQKAVTKYMKAKYDEIKVRVEKGQKIHIQAHAEARGESVNGFIGRAISETMERDSGGAAPSSSPLSAESTPGSGAVSLPPDVLEAAERAAKRTGETAAAFVARVVADQEKRDGKAFKLGINPAWPGTMTEG